MGVLKIPKYDLKKFINVFNRRFGLFIIFVFVLFFDSIYFVENILDSQIPINILMIFGFIVMYWRANPRTKELMIYAVILGFGGEYLFSRGLNMYTYRLENVPLYVPLGHAALYGRIIMFSKAPVVRKYHKKIERLFGICIGIFATVYLIFFSDVFGFVMTICMFLLLWKRPKDKLFFFSMYILVAILEIEELHLGVGNGLLLHLMFLPFCQVIILLVVLVYFTFYWILDAFLCTPKDIK
ncbi:hypothetical protein [Polaribacter sp.]|uniref:hypothetical protein n=1 Tax=Polaribacter sp. TaxID=1920175 RepID=UPI00345D2A5A